MKFDSGKAWQHPVLRPKRYGDDYPYAEFEVDIDVELDKRKGSVSLQAEYCLSDPNLLSLVDREEAKYVLLVNCSKTRRRETIESFEPRIRNRFTAGDLSGRTEFSPFLIATRFLEAYDWSGWHSDFCGLRVDIKEGYVLAVDEPKAYWIDRAEEAPLGSIFVHSASPAMQNERWDVQLDNDRVEIIMSEETSRLYKSVRLEVIKKSDVHYLMNSLYLPALVKVLYEADNDTKTYENFRWYSALNNLLEFAHCPVLGSASSNRVLDAQKLLASPFNNLLSLLHGDSA